MELGELFDAYSRQARLQPALLTLAPLFLTIAVWFPTDYTLATGFVGLAISCGFAALLAHLARRLGRAAEQDLYREWGGKPTTIWFRHRDSHLDHHTKRRYSAFLERRIPDWSAPSPEEEQQDPEGTDRRYEAAVKWLLEYTRDAAKFPLISKENINYGFRRNLYGLRLVGFFLAVSLLAVNLYEQSTYFRSTSGEVRVIGLLLICVCVTMCLCYALLVTRDWVHDAADAYARALLSACDAVGAP